MTSQAIPQNDKALLAAQAKAGQAGVDAYQAAKDEMAADQQQVLQHATQAAQARGGPAQASGLVTSQANDAYNKGQAQLSRGQANTAARSAGRQESMNLYNQMVLGSRSLIEDQAEAAALMINTQSEADVASIRREGESNVNSINSQMELEAAQFEQAMRQAEKDAQLEQSRWEREMEQRERLARMSAAGSGGGDEGRKATQSEIKAALAQGGIARLNEVAGSLGARVDQANITDEALEMLYTGSMEQQSKYSTTANQIFAPLLNNGMSLRDIAEIGAAWDESGKIDNRSLELLAEHRYRETNPTGQDPRASYPIQPKDLDPFIDEVRYEINDLLGTLQIKANKLIDAGLKSANSTGVQITKNDLDFGNLKPLIPLEQNISTAGPGSNSMNMTAQTAAVPWAERNLSQAAKYRAYGSGNNAWLGDMSVNPVTGEQDRLNRELEYSTRDLYANDESMRPFLDTLMNSARGFDDVTSEQGLSESRMIEQILGMRAPDEFSLDDYNQSIDPNQIYTEFLRANPGMADGSGAETARLMFQEAMSGADPAYWDALNVSQEDLIPYMQMGRNELNDANYLDASGMGQGKSLHDLYNPQTSLLDQQREQAELNKSDNDMATDDAQITFELNKLSDNTLASVEDWAAQNNSNFYGKDSVSQNQDMARAIQNMAQKKAARLAPSNMPELLSLWNGDNAQMLEDLENQYIPVGEHNGKANGAFIGLEKSVMDDLSALGELRRPDGEETDYVSLQYAMDALKKTVNKLRPNSEFGEAGYKEFLIELGLNPGANDANGIILYNYMSLFDPDTPKLLSQNALLPPNTGTGPEFVAS